MQEVRIGGAIINEKTPPYVIAEAGINHNGEIEKACAMIRVAKEAGADAVKFQTFKADEFVGDPQMMFTYESQGKEVTEPMLDMFRRYELGRDAWFLLKARCDEEGITFLSTPQNRSDLDLLLEVCITAIKVGSDDFTNTPLLRAYAHRGLPMIISCGMSDMAEVYMALEAVGALDGHPTVLMLCTSEYPTPPEDVNLLKLRTLGNAFPQVVLGFSDHTRGPLASSLAVVMGAKVLEKHFTLDHDLPGPDHLFSEDPAGLKEWVSSVRESWTILGSAIVRPTDKELVNKKEFQRVIVASRNIGKGEFFSVNDITMRRIPGGKGLPPGLISLVLGNPAEKDYKQGEPVWLS
ncbi:MAG: N-acetylneuraminate synthase family protein [Armatimonadetes bacterium]|nr:N-acetylneuraminate synthase family protein [Armatimonadota bacterium]